MLDHSWQGAAENPSQGRATGEQDRTASGGASPSSQRSRQKLDYVVLPPALFSKVIGGAVSRTGVWGGKHGTVWPIYSTMTKPIHAASDHAAIHADLNL